MEFVEILEAKVAGSLCSGVVTFIEPAHLLHCIIGQRECAVTAHLVGVAVVGCILHDAGVTVVTVGSIGVGDLPDDFLGGGSAGSPVERSYEVGIQLIEIGLGDDVVDVGLSLAEIAHIEEHAGEESFCCILVGPHTLAGISGVVILGKDGDSVLEVLQDVVINLLDGGKRAVLEYIGVLLVMTIDYDVLAVLGLIVIGRAPGAGKVPIRESTHEEELSFVPLDGLLVGGGHIGERIGAVCLCILDKFESGVAGGGHIVQILESAFKFLVVVEDLGLVCPFPICKEVTVAGLVGVAGKVGLAEPVGKGADRVGPGGTYVVQIRCADCHLKFRGRLPGELVRTFQLEEIGARSSCKSESQNYNCQYLFHGRNHLEVKVHAEGVSPDGRHCGEGFDCAAGYLVDLDFGIISGERSEGEEVSCGNIEPYVLDVGCVEELGRKGVTHGNGTELQVVALFEEAADRSLVLGTVKGGSCSGISIVIVEVRALSVELRDVGLVAGVLPAVGEELLVEHEHTCVRSHRALDEAAVDVLAAGE